MPRIPSAADVSPVGASATRLPSVRADAADFGLAVAQGLVEFGAGLAAARPLAEEILRKEEQLGEAEQESDVESHPASVRQTAIQMVDEWKYDGSSPRAAARHFSKELAAAEDVRLKGLPPERQVAARESSAGIRVHQAAKDAVPWSLIVATGDEVTEVSTGVAKVTFRLPHAVTLTAVRASLAAASSSGASTFDINEGGTSILSTKLTIDQGEKTSATAATAAVISDASLADDAEITVDVDSAGTGAAGAKVTLIGYKTTT